MSVSSKPGIARLKVLKRDGSVQLFDKNKLLSSISKAGATKAQASLVADRVANRLGSWKQPVPSSQLSSMVARSLSRVNPVASGKYTACREKKLRSSLAPATKGAVFSSVSLSQSTTLKPKIVQPFQAAKPTGDVGEELVEMLGAVGDQLSGYQDVVVQEAYLGTARTRTTIHRYAVTAPALTQSPSALPQSTPQKPAAISPITRPTPTLLPGDTSQPAPLPVATILRVSASPPTASVVLGQYATFTATASGGTPPYTYLWTNGKCTFEKALVTLTITSSPAGTYSFYCRVTDSAASAQAANSNTVSLKVTNT